MMRRNYWLVVGALISSTCLVGCPEPMPGADVQGVDAQGVDAQGGDVQGVDVRGGDVQGVDAQGVDAQGVDAQGVDVQGVDAQGVDAQGDDVQGVDVQGVDAQGDDVQGVDVQGVDAQGNDVQGNDVQGNDVQGNDVQGVDAQGNDVQGNDVQGNDVRGNDVQGNDVQGTVAGETCDNAIMIAAAGTLSGQTTGDATGNYDTGADSTCGPGFPGKDKVYAIDVPASNQLTVTVTPSATFDPAVVIVDGAATLCPDAMRVCAAGTDRGGDGDPETVTFTNTTGATKRVFIIIDNYLTTDTGGTFDLTTSLVMASGSMACSTAEAITTLPATRTGVTVPAAPNNFRYAAVAGCDFGSSGEKVYAVTIPANTGLRVVATPDASTDPALAVITGNAASCDAPTCGAGADVGLDGDPETLNYMNSTAAPQTVFVVLDTFGGGGTTDLQFSAVVPLSNDKCAGAITLTSGTALSGQNTAAGANDYGAGSMCGGASETSGRDLAYQILVPANRMLSVVVSGVSSGFDPTVALVRGPASNCEGTRTCLSFIDNGAGGGDETISYMNSSSSAETIFAIVDGYGGSSGTFTITATVSP